MSGNKIESLNHAIDDTLPHMKQVAAENPNAQVLVRAVTFSSGAKWHVANPTALNDFKWAHASAGGVTDMGHAFRLVAEQLNMPPMPDRGLPPVLVLVSDGQPTDNYRDGLKEIMARPWGTRAVRLAIAIGQDADFSVLQEFIGNPEIKPQRAGSPESLVKLIRWASTAGIQASSKSKPQQAQDQSKPASNVPIQEPPSTTPAGGPATAGDVW
jgi:uncharacterized protein YegL